MGNVFQKDGQCFLKQSAMEFVSKRTLGHSIFIMRTHIYINVCAHDDQKQHRLSDFIELYTQYAETLENVG